MNKPDRVRTSSLFAQVATPLVAVPFSVLLGGWLVLTATAASASQDVLMAQTVVDRLPPPPPTPDSEKQLPPPPIFVPREFDFQAPATTTSPVVDTTNTRLSYLVYVDDASSPTLERVKQLEPQAFVRQYNGRPVVQAGAFARNDNAQQRAQELKSAGVAARVVDLSTGTDTAFVGNSRSYFVVIPDRQENLAAIAAQIRQLQQNATIEVSQLQPRGSHVRVGPFADRSLAEQWNQYLLNAGLRNARVYYGR